eukprot:3148249-Pyramimonas_sp.AAC.1
MPRRQQAQTRQPQREEMDIERPGLDAVPGDADEAHASNGVQATTDIGHDDRHVHDPQDAPRGPEARGGDDRAPREGGGSPPERRRGAAR